MDSLSATENRRYLATAFTGPYVEFNAKFVDKRREFCGLSADFIKFIERRKFLNGRDILVCEVGRYLKELFSQNYNGNFVIDDDSLRELIEYLQRLQTFSEASPALFTYVNVRILGCLRNYN